jgi:hypothetical protein
MTEQNPWAGPFEILADSGNVPWTESCPKMQNNKALSGGAAECGFANEEILYTEGGCFAQHETLYNWAQAQSCNVVNIFMDAQMKINTLVTQVNENDNSETIIINNTCSSYGDSGATCDTVTIKHINLDQTNVVSMKAVQGALVSNETQQMLNLTIMQSATSMVKGLSLNPQSSMSSNMINAFMRTGVTINTNIQQTCKTTNTQLIEINNTNYDTVHISDAIMKQSSNTTQQCLQLTVNHNKLLQSITASLSQIAEATSKGVSLIAFLIVLLIGFAIFMGCGTYFATHEDSIIVWIAVILMILGIVFLIIFFTATNNVGLWYGCSPGLANCKGLTAEEPIPYDSAEAAKSKLMKTKHYIAVDYTIDNAQSGSESGTAVFYKGSSIDPQCYSAVTQPNNNIILGDGSDKAGGVISVRNPLYVVGVLDANQSVPSNSIVGDVFLDTMTGNIFYKLPTGVTYGSTGLSWQKPSTISASLNPSDESSFNVADNVYTDAYDPADGQVSKLSSRPPAPAQVFFWINQDSVHLELDLTHGEVPYPIYGYKDFTSNANNDSILDSPNPYGCRQPVNYGLDNTSQFTANKIPSSSSTTTIHQMPKEGDYFLVPYPYGQALDKNDTVPQQYAYGGVYNLYKAVKDSNGRMVPYLTSDDGKNDSNIVNKVIGYGIVPEFQWERSTCIKTPVKETWMMILSICFFAMSFVLFFMYMLRGKKTTPPKEGQTTANADAAATETNPAATVVAI